MITMNNIYLLEDHSEVLKVWREKKLKGIDLVHIDAHIDFGFHIARPVTQVLNEARNLKELKRDLEYSLAFIQYEKDFDKQTNIGNYIYPAMCEGITKDFYWVIPGRLKEFRKSLKIIKRMLKNFSRQDPYQLGNRSQVTCNTFKDGIISTKLLGRKFVICTLEKLPILKQKVLLDIDTDFLVIDSLLNANNTSKISKRKRWIRPDRLVKDLLNKELKPVFTTISYSVNGGYAPMRYKILGDELAYRFAPKHFKEDYGQKCIASFFFERFESTGKKEYYQKAIKLNPYYRAADNNYGPLYLSLRKFSLAQDEFLRILKVDPKNPACLLGLGNIALERKDFKKAKEYFSSVLDNEPNGINRQNETHKLFSKIKVQGLFGLAQTEFRLKNFKKSKELFLRYQDLKPLQPQSRYFLGCIYEHEKNFKGAANCYQEAIRLGANDIDIILRLIKISSYIKEKGDIIKFIFVRYKHFKRWFNKTERLNLRRKKKFKGLQKIREKMVVLERRLRKFLEKER